MRIFSYPLSLEITLWKMFVDQSKSLMEYIKFSTETLKVSYSCIQNMSKIYNDHNDKIASTSCNQITLCDCRVKKKRPTNGKCQTKDALCDCRVTLPEPRKIYFGLAEGIWKKRYYKHIKSLNHKWYSHETTFSSYLWYLKKTLDVTPKLEWSVRRCTTPYSNISKKCLLCLYGKLVITNFSGNTNF